MAEPAAWPAWAREQTKPEAAASKPEALAGLVVLDVSQANFGALFCSSILAEFGAELIRIEPPGGDPARFFTPFGQLHHGTGLAYLVEGRNKHHVTLSLDSPQGREIFRKLARHADIVIESFSPGHMDGWGIGYRQLTEDHPQLIYGALSTFGQFGPRSGSPIPDYDVVLQALSGLVYINGEPAEDTEAPHAVPTKAGNWLGWYVGGAWLAQALMAAVLYREQSGRGQLVDVSGAEGMMRFLDYNLLWYHTSQRVRERIGSYDIGVFPYTYVRCRDGYVFIAGFSDVNFQALTRIMGREDLRADPGFKTARDRTTRSNQPRLVEEIEKWSVELTADEILRKVMADPGPGTVATGRVNRPSETLAEDHWWQRGAFRRVEDPTYGTLLVQMPPWKMSRTPPRVKWLCRTVGQDNEQIYMRYLGYGKARLAELKASGIL